ncbi:MAG: SIMPL domain-containing protein [Acidimicrobiales bacterium]
MPTRTVLLAGVATALGAALILAGCGGSSRPGAARPPDVPASWSATVPEGRAVLAASTGTSAPAAPGTITTAGVGTVDGTPDTMKIGIGVSTNAPHAAQALSQNNSLAAAVQKALESDGVAAADIQTTGLSLQQSYSPNPAGYQVFDDVTATLRDLSKAGTVVDDAIAAAGDAGRLEWVDLSLADTSPLMAAARKQAVQSAQVQAQQLAAAAGEHLGALVSLTDQAPQGYPQPMLGNFAASGAVAAPAVPVQPGTQQLTVDVTGVWQVTS